MRTRTRPFKKEGETSPKRSIWPSSLFGRGQLLKLALFAIVVGILVYYAKAHWPEISAVFSLGDPVPAAVVLPAEDFFIEFRLDREKTEEEQLDLVRKVMDDQTASKGARDIAHSQYLQIVDAMGKELKIEGILKAKNMDSLVFLSGDSCTVVVRRVSLDPKDVAAIGDTVKRIAKIKPENITVIPTDR